jgi:hypothetical protein
MQHKTNQLNLFVIPSVIYTINRPLSYYPIRTVFSPEQRFEQTIFQIESIREKVPHSYIVLIEASHDQLPRYMEDLLRVRVDHYINASCIPKVRETTDGPAKGYGEAVQLLTYLHSDHFSSIRNACQSISKMSARHRLSDDHVFVVPDAPKVRLQLPNNIYTIFYTMPISEADTYIQALEKCVENTGLTSGDVAIEYVLFDMWLAGRRYISSERLGAEGWCAPLGTYTRI